MGNCQETKKGQYEDDENTIDAPTPEQKTRQRTQNETSMKFISQTAYDEDNYFAIQNDDMQKIMEMPKKMIRKPAPKFESNGYYDGVKKICIDDYIGKYLVLFFYPYDFNKQFQDEIIDFSDNSQKFKKLNCELLGCSIDSHFSHMNYCTKPRNEGGLGNITFPLMADVDRKIAGDYGVLISNGNESGTCLRSTFIIDDKQIVRHLAINDFAGHLKADEILRMVKGIQESDKSAPKSTNSSDKPSNTNTGNQAQKSIFERIGGEEAIEGAVKIFYQKMLADNKVSHFFKSIDMTKQHSQQVSFLSYALGGPKKYVGKSMRDAHQYLRLTNTEFEITVAHLVNTLRDLKVDQSLISEIGKLIEPLRKEIVFSQTASLFDQIGGEKAIDAAVEIFYKKMLEDPKISPFFKSIDMTKQKLMQKLFLKMALGGPKDYKGKNMKDAHQHLNLTDEHFDITVGHLIATLKQLNVDDKIIKQVGTFIEPLRKDIVSVKATAVSSSPSLPSQKDTATNKQPTQPQMQSNQLQPELAKRQLIDRIGGEPKIEVLVGLLVDKFYVDTKINSLFASTDSSKHKETLKTFLVQLTGGAKNYKGKNLRDAHVGLKINDVQFNAFMHHLRESLKQMKVEPSVFHDFCGMIENFRPQIVTVKLTIYERLGGEAAIAIISEKLYTKVQADDRIKQFFVNVDMNKMKEQQKNFLMMATNGPKKYSGKSMKEAHAKLNINDIHFNAFKDNLLLTLKEELVDPNTYMEIANLIETQRMTVVTHVLPLAERIGGDKGILQIVNRFYDRILVDPRIKKFFQNVDMARLRNINHQFLLFCVKVSPTYNGKGMKEAHANLGLNDTHFNLFKEQLLQSMRDCSKDPLSIIEIGATIEKLRDDIVSVKLPLIDRIGGEQMMKKAVEKFYTKLLADPRLNVFFKNIDINNVKNQQNNFLTMLMGGSNNYKGKGMKEAHAALKLTDQHFNFFKEHIQQTFRELGVDNITIAEIARVVEPVRKEVVSARPPLFERIGGDKSLEIIIEKFYDKLIKNPAIGEFFAKSDPTKQKNMLKTFLTTVFGGQQIYKGKKLQEAHAHMKITDIQFNEFRGCMESTLKEMNQNPLIVKEVSAVIDFFRKQVVSAQ